MEPGKCGHSYVAIDTTTYGDSTYFSGGGPGEEFSVTLYVCEICGDVKKGYMGTPNEGEIEDYLDISAEEYKQAERFLEKMRKKKK